MTRGKGHFQANILADAWVTVFTATNTAMMTYPYILGNPDECSPTLAEMAETYIMDSKIMDDSVGNEAVIRRGKHVGADVITPADALHDPDTTTDRIVDLFSKLDDCDEYSPTVMVPLQPDTNNGQTHVDHYYDVRFELRSHGIDITDHRLSVGGVKSWSAVDQLDAVCAVREVVGSEQFLHGLGFGSTSDWIAVLRQHPMLLDSLDMSSIVQDVVNSKKLLTPEMKRIRYPLPRGQNSTVISVMLREFVLYMMSYFLGPHPRETDVPTEIASEKMMAVLNEYNIPSRSDGETEPTAVAD